ncbi:unnamed protein product, partial [Closterium sp. Naga37s-1]
MPAAQQRLEGGMSREQAEFEASVRGKKKAEGGQAEGGGAEDQRLSQLEQAHMRARGIVEAEGGDEGEGEAEGEGEGKVEAEGEGEAGVSTGKKPDGKGLIGVEGLAGTSGSLGLAEKRKGGARKEGAGKQGGGKDNAGGAVGGGGKEGREEKGDGEVGSEAGESVEGENEAMSVEWSEGESEGESEGASEGESEGESEEPPESPKDIGTRGFNLLNAALRKTYDKAGTAGGGKGEGKGGGKGGDKAVEAGKSAGKGERPGAGGGSGGGKAASAPAFAPLSAIKAAALREAERLAGKGKQGLAAGKKLGGVEEEEGMEVGEEGTNRVPERGRVSEVGRGSEQERQSEGLSKGGDTSRDLLRDRIKRVSTKGKKKAGGRGSGVADIFPDEAGPGNGGSARAVPREVRFADFGGIDGVVEQVRELILYPLAHPELYAWLGVEPPRGVLLHGPPGCGKTMLAHAIAREAGVPFFKVAAPEIVSGMSGKEGAKQVISTPLKQQQRVLQHGPSGCGKTMLAHAIAREAGVPFFKIAAPEIVSGMSGKSRVGLNHVGATFAPEFSKVAPSRVGSKALNLNARLAYSRVVMWFRGWPSGCGKTMLAHAIAREAGVPFFKIAAPEVVSGMSGESEAKLRSLFSSAERAAPAILFIDEIDAITPKRETAQREMERRIVAQLLTCLDDLQSSPDASAGGGDGEKAGDGREEEKEKEQGKGMEETEKDQEEREREREEREKERRRKLKGHVVVIGATNRPDSLDPALRRAGRFDREISLGIPDESARARILEVLSRKLRLEGSFDFRVIARRTPGFVGADLAALAKEAAAIAVKRIFTSKEAVLVGGGGLGGAAGTGMAAIAGVGGAGVEGTGVREGAAGVSAAAAAAAGDGDCMMMDGEVNVPMVNGEEGEAQKKSEGERSRGGEEGGPGAEKQGEAGGEEGREKAGRGEVERGITGGGEAWREPWKEEELQALSITMGDFERGAASIGRASQWMGDFEAAVAKVQPSAKSEGFATIPGAAVSKLQPSAKREGFTTIPGAAVSKVQPSAKREGFTTIPGVTLDDVGALGDAVDLFFFPLTTLCHSPPLCTPLYPAGSSGEGATKRQEGGIHHHPWNFLVAITTLSDDMNKLSSLSSLCTALYLSVPLQAAVARVQPSAKREGFTTIPGVTWDDVGALADVREELEFSISRPIKYPEEYEAMGLRAATGILLYGPPGCGKTLVAKAIANDAGANFISIKGPELLNKYVGESERSVRQLFVRARASSPCVLFFDEMDAMAPRRGSDGNGAAERVVNQLLTEMDGLESRKSVYIIAATN